MLTEIDWIDRFEGNFQEFFLPCQSGFLPGTSASEKKMFWKIPFVKHGTGPAGRCQRRKEYFFKYLFTKKSYAVAKSKQKNLKKNVKSMCRLSLLKKYCAQVNKIK